MIASAFLAACEAELLALKPGNVHVHAPGHGMTVADFRRSAEVAAPWIAARGLAVGERVHRAVAATRAACGQNTNLGILLLAAPLAAAAERPEPLREAVGAVLRGLNVADAVEAFAAIRLAAPGGLGRSDRHDVAEQPTVTLLAAMQAAAGRDRIAAQYANGFADVLGFGLGRLAEALAAGLPEPRAMTAVYMALLGRIPDTHVARKHGEAVAVAVTARAAALGPDAEAAALLELDAELKREGINPGTTADLTVAVHFAAGLETARGGGARG